MSGYIKLHRGWRDTDGLTPSTNFSDCEAWLWLLENAAWKPRTRFNSKGQEIHLQRGQLHVSIRGLCTAWGWSRKRVCTFLGRIEAVSKVVTKRGQSGTILTICKYDEYQNNGDSQGHGRGTVGGQSGDTQEESKEGKEGKKNRRAVARPDGFDPELWADFKRHRKAAITQRALDGFRREAQKAGWSLEEAIAESIERGWQGFKADWVEARRARVEIPV